MAHEVFPGNTADVKTFAGVLKTLKQRFEIRRVILVGDRGMVSGPVLKEIEAEGMEYIVGVKMRKAKAMTEVLSRAGRYKEVKDNLRVKEVGLDGERYVVCLNPEKAGDPPKVGGDRQAQEEMVGKLRERLRKTD